MGAIRRTMFGVGLCAVVMLSAGAGRALGADWPNYRGPNYNGITRETDWSSDWGDSGPKVL